jgi:S-adenosylmethionine/arginine decarboxylase-like enzyme
VLGLHWIADVFDCEPERLTAQSLEEALVGLPASLGLTRVGEPQVVEHRTVAGTSLAGIVLIRESHVSMHCFFDQHAVHVDVFSCKALDRDVARRFVQTHFVAARVEDHLLVRGGDAGALGDEIPDDPRRIGQVDPRQ